MTSFADPRFEKADASIADHIQLALTAILKDYPGPPSQRPPRLAEDQLSRISELLALAGKTSWSKIPRIYSILHMIERVELTDTFVRENITDLWLPFAIRTLPDSFRSVSDQYAFIEVQDLVLTKALDLEREDGKHRHFAKSDEIPLKKIQELGRGGFGSVDRVLSTITHREYARKLIPRGKTFRKNADVLRDFERELGHLKKLRHEHIVQLIGSYTDTRYVGILMAPVAETNLKDFLANSSHSIAQRSLLRTFYGCLATAVQYLHEHQVRHKDIKPQNILVKGHQVFLTDFGISLDWSEFGESTTTGNSTGKTERYCAPEVAKNLRRNTLSDLWSLGCVYLEMWTVLRGETVVNLFQHLETYGSGSTCYHLNFEGAVAWCNRLGANGSDENPPLKWILGTLQLDPKTRWTAKGLVASVMETDEDHENSLLFIGNCCSEHDDSTVSGQSSRRSSIKLDDTGASSIEVYDPSPRSPKLRNLSDLSTPRSSGSVVDSFVSTSDERTSGSVTVRSPAERPGSAPLQSLLLDNHANSWSGASYNSNAPSPTSQQNVRPMFSSRSSADKTTFSEPGRSARSSTVQEPRRKSQPLTNQGLDPPNSTQRDYNDNSLARSRTYPQSPEAHHEHTVTDRPKSQYRSSGVLGERIDTSGTPRNHDTRDRAFQPGGEHSNNTNLEFSQGHGALPGSPVSYAALPWEAQRVGSGIGLDLTQPVWHPILAELKQMGITYDQIVQNADFFRPILDKKLAEQFSRGQQSSPISSPSGGLSQPAISYRVPLEPQTSLLSHDIFDGSQPWPDEPAPGGILTSGAGVTPPVPVKVSVKSPVKHVRHRSRGNTSYRSAWPRVVVDDYFTEHRRFMVRPYESSPWGQRTHPRSLSESELMTYHNHFNVESLWKDAKGEILPSYSLHGNAKPPMYMDSEVSPVKSYRSSFSGVDKKPEIPEPPWELMYKGYWDEARGDAIKNKKWMLVDIQNPLDPGCRELNRNLWKDENVADTVRENFVFVQYDRSDSRGVRYTERYLFDEKTGRENPFPHIAIVNPTTGRQMSVLMGKVPQPASFIGKLHDFIDENRHKLESLTRDYPY